MAVYTADIEIVPAGRGRWLAKGAVTHDGSIVRADFDWFVLTATTPDEASAAATRTMLDAAATQLRVVWC